MADTSPGRAMARRHALELSLTRRLLAGVSRFLDLTRAAHPAGYGGSWQSLVADLGPDTESRALLAADPLPDLVWSSARAAVMSAPGDPTVALAKALDLATGTAQLSPDPDTDELDSEGMSWRARVERLGRTHATAVQGRADLAELTRQGFTAKRWVAHHDEATRTTHAEADGQTVSLDTPFTVGGWPLQYPADHSAPTSETVNCRCVLVGAGVTLAPPAS